MATLIGSRLGPYEILEPLGAGGMGEVWEARDPRLDRLVALKILPTKVAADPDHLARFEREAKAVAALNHPNIVTLHGIEEADGVGFLVMERIHGCTLSELIAPGGLPLGKILELAIPIADALAAAHAHGVIHRDLKPGNVMVSDEGRPKILDFGLARVTAPPSSPIRPETLTETLTAQGVVFGTVPYMAPEQLRGERADARADLFSFGVILYEMASGRRPFDGASGAEVAASILKEDPPPLESLNSGLPATFARIVARCLEKDPSRRLQSAADLRYELSDLAEELRTRPKSLAPARPPSTGRITRKHWGRLAAISAVLLAVAGSVLVLRPFASKTASATPMQSLAVLPLKNYSGDASQDYFAEGMTDVLIADLAQIRALKVISRTSVMQYADTKKPIPQIARELGVDGIVEGSVVRSGSRVRITAQLIDARQDRHVWASHYEREMTDVLALQGEVVRAIAGEIRVQVTPQERQRLAAQRTVEPGAYDDVLKGRLLLEHATTEKEIRAAIDLFKRATEQDPAHAPGWAGLAEATWTLAAGVFEFVPPGSVRDEALGAARKALELDENLAEAHNARAQIAWDAEWDLEAAGRHFQKAIELRPGYAAAHYWYVQLLLGNSNRCDEAREHLKVARELDPFSPWNEIGASALPICEHRPDRLVEESGRILATSPGNFLVRWNRGLIYLQLKKPDFAVADFESAIGPSGRNALLLSYLGLAYGQAGRQGDARRILRELQDLSRTRYVSPYAFLWAHLGVGEKDEAYRALEKAFAERTPGLIELCSNGPYRFFLDSAPRFAELRGRICRAVKMPRPG
ncbi:MAG: protein kinase [Acidobacteriota bacterium]